MAILKTYNLLVDITGLILVMLAILHKIFIDSLTFWHNMFPYKWKKASILLSPEKQCASCWKVAKIIKN